jgi:1-acyl-sn-glycerol-3-phosphate acyltransferase
MGRSEGGRNEILLGLIRVLGWLFFLPFMDIRFEGRDRIPSNGAFVLLPKHQRWEDIPIIGLACPHALYYIAKMELFRTRLTRWFISSLGGLPLDRQQPLKSRESLRRMTAILEGGGGIVVFPEGTYYRGRVGAGRIGIVRLLLSRVFVPFIPVGLEYRRKRWRTVVTVRFGHPCRPEEGEADRVFLGRVMQDIARLSGLGPRVRGRRRGGHDTLFS